jgi:hypothetical protein
MIEEYARHVGHADLIRGRRTGLSVRTLRVITISTRSPTAEPGPVTVCDHSGLRAVRYAFTWLVQKSVRGR